MLKLALVVALGVAALPTVAQHARPYAGMHERSIKALSDQQIDDLKAGRGMGLALPAELNGYPGPSHALELTERIGLSPEHGAKLRTLFAAMKADAIPLGERLIREEAHLDHLFASKSVTPEALATATRDIGLTQAELRNAHLKYHLATVAIMSPEQVKRYGELRGYAAGGAHPRGHSAVP